MTDLDSLMIYMLEPPAALAWTRRLTSEFALQAA